MAKKIEIDVTGLSVTDVIELDPTHIKGISEKSLAKLTSRLVSAYNKRAKRLEKSGLAESSPAYRAMKEEGNTRLSVKGKTYNELFRVYAQAKRALTERTTFSVKGTKDLMKKTTQRIGYEFKDKDESSRFWEAIDLLKDKGIGIDKRTSDDIQREVSDLMFKENMSVDDVLHKFGITIEAQTPDAQKAFDEMIDDDAEREFNEWIEEQGKDDYPW